MHSTSGIGQRRVMVSVPAQTGTRLTHRSHARAIDGGRIAGDVVHAREHVLILQLADSILCVEKRHRER